jgi:hypothetical protein
MTGFAEVAEQYAQHAAVIPCGGADGKRPLVAWRDMTRANAAKNIPEWRRKFADANVGLLTGPSKITVIDIDAADDGLIRDIVHRFGDTPLQAQTPRGRHLFYRSAGEPTKTKIEKLPVDIRGSGGFIVVPPSTRRDGGRYEFIIGTPAKIDDLPQMRAGALVVQNRTTSSRIGIGRRNEALWLLSMTEARSSATEAELLARALILNESRCNPPLEHDEVCRIVGSAWGYQQRGTNWVGQGARVYVEIEEIEGFAATPDALALLVALRKAHLGFREKFAVSPRALAAEGLFCTWTERRIRKARDKLLDAGALCLVHAGGHGQHDPAAFAFPLKSGASSRAKSVYPIVGRNRTTKKTAQKPGWSRKSTSTVA